MSVWQALVYHGFIALLSGFPVVIFPIGYCYYIVYLTFIDVKEEEMLDGLSESSYVPSQLVLEPLPYDSTKTSNIPHRRFWKPLCWKAINPV